MTRQLAFHFTASIWDRHPPRAVGDRPILLTTMSGSCANATQRPEWKTSLTSQQQWSLLRRFIEDLPLSECKSVNSNFIKSLASSVLHIFLIRKRAELDLLGSEASHVELPSDCSIQFPNYGNASPPASPSEELASFLGKKAKRDMRIDLSEFTPRKLGAEGFPTGDLRSPISPLSPSFGPRRGEMLSGTVLRRRSIPPQSPHASQPAHVRRTSAISKEEALRLTREDRHKRVQFEAAWKEIEAHLDEYIGKFGLDAEDIVGGKQKTAIWEILISCREEADELVERIRTRREN
ncbi:hypothetical protein BDV96DRAFT_210887 [Lophiotrema nucula]|uniref:Uncharacterized protein n=1 Tax=Lophiotrema nucula TaxID=690887 RepID=A0A6A5ZQY4_9PLEO|nr:hypothetical protein BDV96DRAFT_210887 [Lophiotrema nucula]